MKNFLETPELRLHLERIRWLYCGQFFLCVAALIKRSIMVNLSVGLLAEGLLLFLVYSLGYKALKNLFYTYWVFSFLLALYILRTLVIALQTEGGEGLFLLSSLALILLSLSGLALFSPLYFPRTSWWQMDFRYRGDLIIEIFRKTQNEGPLKGRLTDIRRQSASILSFAIFDLGEKIALNIRCKYEEYKLEAEVVNIRETLAGRGIVYGLKLKLSSKDDFLVYHEVKQDLKAQRVKRDY